MGLVGFVYIGDVINCYNMGNVLVIGGVERSTESGAVMDAQACGISYSGNTINCYNYGKVLAQYKGQGNIEDYSNYIEAYGIQYQAETGKVINCYNLGEITGDGDACGIVRYEYSGMLSDCYNNAKITSNYKRASGIELEIVYNNSNGGLINTGKVYGKTGAFGIADANNISNSYYLAGQVYVNGVQKADDSCAKTQEEIEALMKPILEVVNTPVTNSWGQAINEGNAFVADTNNINNGLPILKWQVEH